MNLKDPATRIRRLGTMCYSADGRVLGIEIERNDGATFEVTVDEDGARRLVELLLSLAKQAAKAPQAEPLDLKRWTGTPIDVDQASGLEVSTATHAVMALSFGRVSLGIRLPRLFLDQILQLEAPAARQADVGKKPKAN